MPIINKTLTLFKYNLAYSWIQINITAIHKYGMHWNIVLLIQVLYIDGAKILKFLCEITT